MDSAVNHSHSWWWDSHVSPKHSRWLKENLTDMDLKVKDMLKLIEEDADSFAKRAEMYYKKRPELISLVEEFYRGYRALAERYDHITGELHHVQCNMEDAFPNQMHYAMDDVSPRASLINKQSQGHLGKELEGFDSFLTETGHRFLDSKQTVDTLVFSEEMGLEIPNPKLVPRFPMQKRTGTPSGQIEVPNEITKLQKEFLSLQQEKEILKGDYERGSEQFRVVEEQFLKLQEKLQHVQEENHKLNDDSSSYVARISQLEEQLCMLKKQKSGHIEEGEASSQKLQSETQEKDKLILEIQNMEAKLQSERQNIQTEYECFTPEHRNNGKTLANLRDELFKFHHENHNLRVQVMTGVQQLQKANEEIQNLHQALLTSQAENDTMVFQYQQSLKLYEAAENRAKDLQIKMAHLNEENKRIKDEIAGGVLCMNNKEERTQNLEREKSAFQQDTWHRIQRTTSLQDGPITKYNEEQNVGIKLQDESMQMLKFDAVLKNYQQSMSQLQEHQKILSIELQARNERLKDADKRIKLLEEEISHLQEDNGNLKEKSSSTVVSIKNLEKEVYTLKKDKNSLLNEVTFRVDQRDALQQELYCLKEDRNDLDRRFQTMLKQIQSLGLDAESIQLVCINLQDISQKLREYRQIGEDDNVNVPQVLQKMEEFIKKNETLENSVASHHLELERLEFEIKLLQESVQSLQKEKADLKAESRQHNDRVKELEVELESVHNVYAQLQGDNQQLKEELADALEHMKHLEEQTFKWQGEKEALLNKIAESTHQVSHSQKQVDLLEAEGKDLRHKLEEETNNVQTLEIEIEKLQQVICQMDSRNQVLSDECDRLIDKCSSAEEKAMELEKINSKQQKEHNVFLNSFSTAIEYQRELDREIEKLQIILDIPDNVEGNARDANLNGMKLLHGIVENVKKLQTELSYLQEENKKLLNDVLAKTAHLEQLQKDMFVLCSEKESIEEEASTGIKKLSNLQQEIVQLQEEMKAIGMKLEDGMEREKNLESDLRSLQQSLASSVSARFALEDECQRTLEKYSSTMACLKGSESMLLEMELENQALLTETLAQISLVTMLENIIVEKDENIQLMEKQLNTFQEKSSKLENGLQSCATKAEMQEIESQQLRGSTCGLHEEEQQRDTYNEFIVIQGHQKLNLQIQTGSGHVKEMEEYEQHEAVQERNEIFAKDFLSVEPKDAMIEMIEKDLQQEVSMWTDDSFLFKSQMPVGYEDRINVEDTLHALQEEKQITSDEISCSAIQACDLQAIVIQQQKQGGKPRKPRERSQESDIKAGGHQESLQLSQSVDILFENGHWKNIDEFQNPETRTWECQEGIPLIENDKGKQGIEEAHNSAGIRESELMFDDLETEKNIMGAKASSVLRVCLEEDVGVVKEQSETDLSEIKSRKTDFQKLQDHWRRQCHGVVGQLQVTETGMSSEVETQACESDIPTACHFLNDKEENNQLLKDQCQDRIKELCDAPARLEGTKNDKMQQLEYENRLLKAEHESNEYKILEFQKEERILKNELRSGVNEVEAFDAEIQEAKEFETQNLEAELEEKLWVAVADVDGSGTRCRQVKELQERIRELQVIVRDLQQENIKLKGQRWNRSAVASIMGMKEEHPYMKGKNSRLMLVEGSLNDQDEKEVIVHEVKTGTNIEDKISHEIYLLQEQNHKFVTRVDSVTLQIQKLQLTFEELQEKFQKMMQDARQPKEDRWRGVENNAIEKRFRELQDELLLWLELNDMLTKEVQYRFASVNRIQAEIAATKGDCSGEECEEIESAVSQAARLQREILSIQEQNSTIADRLQSGSDKARGLEFEVERILLKFQGEMKTSLSDHTKKADIRRVRVPLRTFLFGKKEHGQKQRAFFACTQPITNE